MLTYNALITAQSQEDLVALRQMLEWEQLIFNEASKIQFARFQKGKHSATVFLHAAFYKKFRREHPEIPAQLVVRGMNSVLATYRSIKSNKHKISAPAVKKNLSLRLDKRLYAVHNKTSLRITTSGGRKIFSFKNYPKLNGLLLMVYRDPLLFERDGKLYIALTFDSGRPALPTKLALGVDLGVRISAACSDGRLIRDKTFNSRKRRIRHLKKSLQKRGTKSAQRHLKKISCKERRMTKDFNHKLANAILDTKADTIVLENLKGLTANKRGKNGTKQVCFAKLREILTYKAVNAGKRVVLVSPCYTSQTDPITGQKSGERRGRRFYANNGLVYDADISASWNIARRSKLPFSQGNLLAGQGIVNTPIVCKPSVDMEVLQATTL